MISFGYRTNRMMNVRCVDTFAFHILEVMAWSRRMKFRNSSRFRSGNGPGGGGEDLGGLKAGLSIPTVPLKPKGRASFWIYGTDGSYRLSNGHQSRCNVSYKMLVRLPGAATSIDVSPLRADGFFWCGGIYVHPITSGDSGTDPARPLSYFRGITT